jgi:hypothetical protein
MVAIGPSLEHGADVDVYALGHEECPLVSECKSRKAGGGFVQLERWLGENDLLFLRRDHAEPLVLLPWRVWARLLAKVRPTADISDRPQPHSGVWRSGARARFAARVPRAATLSRRRAV